MARSPRNTPSEVALGYAAVAIFSLLIYLIVIGPYIRFLSTVLPGGDPFTYTIGYFLLLDRAHEGHTPHLLLDVFTGHYSWYWLTNSLVLLFSPFMAKEPYSIAFINFFVYGVATAAWFHMGRRLGCTVVESFLVSLVIWIWPINFGFSDYSSIAVLGLDSAFSGALYAAVACGLAFAVYPSSRTAAILSALSAGVAVWGRGNSLAVVGLCLTVPAIAVTFRAVSDFRQGRRESATNALVAGAIFLVMAFYFYYVNWGPITHYYADHAKFVERHSWTLKDAMPYLRNIPGFMMLRYENSLRTLGLSLVSHAFVVATLIAAFWRRSPVYIGENSFGRIFAVTGSIIYFGTYGVNLALFTDPHITLLNALLIWRPMLAGLSVLAVPWVIHSFGIWPRFMVWPAIPVAMLAMLAYAHLWNYKLTPRESAVGRPSPVVAQRFYAELDAMLEGGHVSFLYYENYNPALYRYYSIKDKGIDPRIFRSVDYDRIWNQTDYSAENKARILTELRKHFREANLVVIPEFWKHYWDVEPYAFYRFRKEVADLLNEPGAPRFRVRAWAEERQGIRMLVIQRTELARGKGDPFDGWLPEPVGPPRQFSAAVAGFPLSPQNK
jgi:hypothetical protein